MVARLFDHLFEQFLRTGVTVILEFLHPTHFFKVGGQFSPVDCDEGEGVHVGYHHPISFGPQFSPYIQIGDDIEQDIAGEDLDDIVLLGIENLTGFDLFIGFNIDDEFQGIFVFNGETVLLEYDCFETIELLFEDDFEPETGVFIEGFDLFDSIFEAGVDFDCGDVLIVTFDVDEIVVFSEPLN